MPGWDQVLNRNISRAEWRTKPCPLLPLCFWSICICAPTCPYWHMSSFSSTFLLLVCLRSTLCFISSIVHCCPYLVLVSLKGRRSSHPSFEHNQNISQGLWAMVVGQWGLVLLCWFPCYLFFSVWAEEWGCCWTWIPTLLRITVLCYLCFAWKPWTKGVRKGQSLAHLLLTKLCALAYVCWKEGCLIHQWRHFFQLDQLCVKKQDDFFFKALEWLTETLALLLWTRDLD